MLCFLPTMSCAMMLCAMLFRANDQQFFATNAKLRNKDENMALSALKNQIKTIYLYSKIKYCSQMETMICQLLQKMQQFMNENRLQEYKCSCCKKCNNLSKVDCYTLLLRDK